MMSDKKLFIGDLSKRTDVPVRTIRYDEDCHLLDRPERTWSKRFTGKTKKAAFVRGPHRRYSQPL